MLEILPLRYCQKKNTNTNLNQTLAESRRYVFENCQMFFGGIWVQLLLLLHCYRPRLLRELPWCTEHSLYHTSTSLSPSSSSLLVTVFPSQVLVPLELQNLIQT